MGLTAFNRQRRKAAAALHLASQTTSTAATSDASVPESPETGAAAAQENSASNLLPALKLANSAESSDDLTPIPTVGKGAGKVIFDQRPDGGYQSVESFPKEIFEPPFNCDVEKISDWEG